TFAFAATDTTSNALSRTLHLLAMDQKAQERLRIEVSEALETHNGSIPYDALVSLPYLDAVSARPTSYQRVRKTTTLSPKVSLTQSRFLERVATLYSLFQLLSKGLMDAKWKVS
ncbi:hypothetical protein H0H93_000780, partial [Arthromyces matolae]